MINKLDHLIVAVKNIEEEELNRFNLLNLKKYKANAKRWSSYVYTAV